MCWWNIALLDLFHHSFLGFNLFTYTTPLFLNLTTNTFPKMMLSPEISPDSDTISEGISGKQLQQWLCSIWKVNEKFGAHKIENYLSHKAHTCRAAKTFVSCSWYSDLVIWCSIKIWGRAGALDMVQRWQMSPFVHVCSISNGEEYLCRRKRHTSSVLTQPYSVFQTFNYHTFSCKWNQNT